MLTLGSWGRYIDRALDNAKRPAITRDSLLALALATLLLALGLLRHAPFTPDEPREFDIAWNMLHQADKAVPLLAGEPFCEKPPLTYWSSAISMGLFGPSVLAARVPNLFWSTITLLCLLSFIGSVVPKPLRNRALVLTAFIAATMLLLLRVQLWLATDAPLVATTAIALLGQWRGFNASNTRTRLLGYTLLHVGLIGAFFAKNLLGWIVPIFTLLGFIVWEKRWRELWRWEMYAGLLLQAACIAPWLWSVAHYHDGARLLRIFFVDNTLGRFLPMATEEHYQQGHRNHFGKYFLELPYYLLPWTFLALAALRWSYSNFRHRAAAENAIVRLQMSALRFSLLTALPGLLLLSFSQTARDVYLAPELLGFSMLIGLWFGCGLQINARFDRMCIRATVVVAIVLGIVLAALSVAIPAVQSQWSLTRDGATATLLLATLSLLFTQYVVNGWRSQWPPFAGIFSACGIFAAGIIFVCAVLLPSMDRSQDLRPTARAIAAAYSSRPIGILRDDETMRAYFDFGANLRAANFRSPQAAADWLREDPARVLVIELQTDHVTPAARALLKSMHASWAGLAPPDINVTAVDLQKRGFSLLSKHEIMGGRTYGVLAYGFLANARLKQ